MKKYAFIISVLFLFIESKAQNIITTVAGNGMPAFSGDGGQATIAKINYPLGVAFDALGNMYIVDDGNARIRKVSTTGIITTVAGGGTVIGDGGLATSAQLYWPQGIAFDASGNMYFGDNNRAVRKVDASGIITTVAGNATFGYSGDGGPATSAQLNQVTLITFDALGNLYIADYGNHRIRKVNTSGIISTVVGNGTAGFSGDGGLAVSAQLNYPNGITVDLSGNMYIADSGNNRIRKVNTAGIITTIAGIGTAGFSGDGGVATSAELKIPSCISIDGSANIFIADAGNNRIRMIDASGIITTIAGTGTIGYSGDGGSAILAQLALPQVITIASGNLYIADTQNNRIRKVTNVAGISQTSIRNQITIYPNPTSNSISINVEGVTNYQNSTITIQNIVGQTVKKLPFAKSIDVSEFPQGCYFLQITLSSAEIYKTKFIKQ